MAGWGNFSLLYYFVVEALTCILSFAKQKQKTTQSAAVRAPKILHRIQLCSYLPPIRTVEKMLFQESEKKRNKPFDMVFAFATN
ncbi:MAG: hypothetical protein V1684_02245, partial [bacterium]